MLPSPSHSFSIPSVHDSLKLDCRLYHSRASSHTSRLKAAIIAHPYAPLGGSYDDPVVAVVGKALLKKGYVLGTFNFRGARGSPGRTSWSAKPELADYVSFYGFMLLYLSSRRAFLEASKPLESTSDPILILGGYSYGSMITAHLPAKQGVSNLFNTSEQDSPQARSFSEIRERAEELAKSPIWESHGPESHTTRRSQNRQSLEVPGSPPSFVASGGSESSNTSRSLSCSSSKKKKLDFGSFRRSSDRSRRGEGNESRKSLHNSSDDRTNGVKANVQIRYLLVSPLLPPVAGLTTMFSKLEFQQARVITPSQNPDPLEQLPVCAIYGDSDIFTSRKRLNHWAEAMREKSTSTFTKVEVPGTGHFWHEDGSTDRLTEFIQTWVTEIEVHLGPK